MSGPLRMTAEQVRDLAAFMDALTKATNSTGVRADGYDRIHVRIPGDDGPTIAITYDAGESAYVVDDRVGD